VGIETALGKAHAPHDVAFHRFDRFVVLTVTRKRLAQFHIGFAVSGSDGFFLSAN